MGEEDRSDVQWLVLFDDLEFGWTLSERGVRRMAAALQTEGPGTVRPPYGARALTPFASPVIDG